MPASRQPTTWGFVAAGKMAAAMAADLRFAQGSRVGGVFSRTPESAAAFARRFGGQAYGSLDAMLADPAIDVVYVSSPNNLHYEQTKAALLAGKPVLCEKTFTLNAPQLAELIELARSRKLFLMEAMWVRWLPLVARLRELLQRGAIGQPLHLSAAFFSQPPIVDDNRFYNPALGGGALLDLGIYPVSFASLVFGQPQEIMSKALLAPTGVDIRFAATFQYASGATAQLAAGFDGRMRHDIMLLGSEGNIRIEMDRGGWKMRRLHLQQGGGTRTLTAPYKGQGYGYQAAEVASCLAAGQLESEAMPLDESLAIMRTLDTLRAHWGMRYPGE
ncbi:MAG: Gfo/Idh/MocA family oxidoreductase [Anaerolineales bacterium]|nr:MAG: Gfo/Idh/MocA family oxidoreductase [Anaerolineales bacterium]